ncbi:MAG: RagB/SusD family nutrient uptake outer membrane protein [Paludibacter sp.]|nr:RagB/SusD family nutrient uptake outer membrane protein [Paludibacter sp.]
MKIKKNFALIGIALLLLLCSCNDYEKLPIEQYTIDYVFSTTDSMGVNAKGYLDATYAIMYNGHNRVGGDYLDAATDDAVSSSLSESSVQSLFSGSYTPTSVISREMEWGRYYTGIRKANTFITNIGVVPLMRTFKNNVEDSIPLKRAWKAEARFLRAYFYFELVKRYGGVPIVSEKPYALGDNLEIPRNTFGECIDYIVNELDTIKDSLRSIPIADVNSEGHVVTQEAAMALKCRVLLYAASPLFNEHPIPTDNDAQKPFIGYQNYDAERWKRAADAAKQFIDSYPYFSLNLNYANTFLNDYGVSNNKEVIFFRQGSMNTQIEYNNGPVGFAGTNVGLGRTSPTQNLVDAFPMKDGKAIGDPTSKYTYSINKMYTNRDSRLDLTVLHNGSNWLSTSLQTFNGGINNPAGALQKTKTSYYLRKFMGLFESKTTYVEQLHNWVMFRYAEILLNYAEAKNEYEGPSNDVYQVLKNIRKRAKIEAGTDGMYGLKSGMIKEEMRAAIQNERRIEMAFEEQRYWDIRRWRIAEDIFKKPLQGLSITKDGTTLNYNIITVATTNFETKRYLYPIPYSEVVKNSKMIQNPNW